MITTAQFDIKDVHGKVLLNKGDDLPGADLFGADLIKHGLKIAKIRRWPKQGEEW